MTSGSSLIRVRSIPAGHDYVRHAVGAAPGVMLLADPVLDPADPARWWPHPALEAAERPEVLDGADLVHVHFGYEHRTPGQIAEFVAALRSRRMPLVVTVHDLTNPHEPDPAAHLERTGHLVRGADEVITLTRGAAAEIRRRWGADAHVVPHPRLMPADVTEPHRRRRAGRAGRATDPADAGDGPGEDTGSGSDVSAPGGTRTLGVVLGSLRAGIAAENLLPRLVEALPHGVRLRVMVRSDALAAARGSGHARHAAARAVDGLAANPRVEVRPHDLLTDERLCARLDELDALVLPHRHGTHSGWLELCRDLGLPPVIPRIGYLAEQWDPASVESGTAESGTAGSDAAGSGMVGSSTAAAVYDPVDTAADDLRRALSAALDGPPVPARAPEAEDAAVAAAHARIYRTALARAGARRP